MRGTKRSKYREPIEDRKHSIEDDEVEAAIGGAEQPVLTVDRLLDAVPLLGQPLGEVGCGLAIILDQQDLAAHSAPAP